MELLMDANVAYVLLVSGFVLAILALFAPGTGLIELGALFALALSGYEVLHLQINIWALVILILGVFPFLLALRRSGRWIFLVISMAAFAVGSIFMFSANNGLPAVNPILAVFVTPLSIGLLWLVARKGLDAILRKPDFDLQKLVGAVGDATTAINHHGSVYVGGEQWSARSQNPIPAGTRVQVIRRDGFVLEVEPFQPPIQKQQ
jgi:membrane-bound ClpP family serine protease